MPWAVLNDGQEDEIELLISDASTRVLKIGGEYSRAFDGTLRATVSTEKQEWTFTTAPISESDATAIAALFENGAQFTLSGDCVGGDSFDCMGSVTSVRYVHDRASHKKVLELLLQQV